MPAKINLIGQKYSHLTVIRESEIRKHGRVTWECLCDCGNPNIILVTGKDLRNGNTQSCGCLKRKDLIGQKFGKLTVIKATDMRKHGSVVWECKCDCGNPNPVYATTEGLRVGDNTSCGCYSKAKEKFAQTYRIDLVGKRFGKLTVLSATEKRTSSGNVIWHCICDCGNECFVSTNHLQTGNTKSCGCLQGYSYGEIKIAELLKENNVKFKSQYIFPNFSRRYDFAILNEDGEPIQLIEFDGEQHYVESEFFGTTLKEQQEIDKIKTEFAESIGIPLIRIPYWERENLKFEDLQIKRSKNE